MARAEDPIAVFDSGLGGISVLRELVRQLPHERFVYFGDSVNAPYGTRTTAQVQELTMRHVAALLARGAKAVVIACNTATSAAIEPLRARYPDAILIGIEPALKLAVEQGPAGRIIVMATEVTLREEKFANLIAHYGATRDICRLPCPRLVEFVERGELDSAEAEAYLRATLLPCLTPDTGSIVLGCTHFPFLRPLIARLAGPDIAIYDGSAGTAAQTARRLAQKGLLAPAGPGSVTLENSLACEKTLQLARTLLTIE